MALNLHPSSQCFLLMLFPTDSGPGHVTCFGRRESANLQKVEAWENNYDSHFLPCSPDQPAGK